MITPKTTGLHREGARRFILKIIVADFEEGRVAGTGSEFRQLRAMSQLESCNRSGESSGLPRELRGVGFMPPVEL